MEFREQPLSKVSDRRRHRRRSTAARIKMAVDPGEIAGDVENLSRSGVLFFTGTSFRVRLEIEENGTVTKRSGRIVRAQRMRGDSYGWAIEFDP